MLVLNITDLKKSFTLARKETGLEDFRFHDARHTAITRMVRTKHPHLEIMKISGHTQMTTFARYVNPDTQTIQTIANSLSNYNEEMSELNESKVIH
jgi:integrase